MEQDNKKNHVESVDKKNEPPTPQKDVTVYVETIRDTMPEKLNRISIRGGEMRVIAEIVKEYVLYPDELVPLEFTVKGRITKIKGNDGVYKYEWSISHYYKPSEHAGGVHVPSSRSSISLKEAEDSLFAYMGAFTNIGIKPNNFY